MMCPTLQLRSGVWCEAGAKRKRAGGEFLAARLQFVCGQSLSYPGTVDMRES